MKKKKQNWRNRAQFHFRGQSIWFSEIKRSNQSASRERRMEGEGMNRETKNCLVTREIEEEMQNGKVRMKDKGDKRMFSGRARWFVRVLPVNEVKEFLQVFCVDVGFAELQLSSRVVVNVVNTHFLHDAKTSLKT